MKLNVQSQDTLAGLFFVLFGVFSLHFAADYPMGTAVRMGPGYFPTMVAWCTIVLGVLITVGGLATDGEPVEPPHLRSLLFVTAGVVLFGLLIDRAGLVIATAVLVVLARLAGPDYRQVKEIAAQYVVLTIAVAALFVWALKLPIPIWPV